MPAYKTGKKTNQYTTEFKAAAVKLTFYSGATVKGVAESLDIPWLNIAKEVALVAEIRGHSNILLLGTKFTFNSTLYPDAFSSLGS